MKDDEGGQPLFGRDPQDFNCFVFGILTGSLIDRMTLNINVSVTANIVITISALLTVLWIYRSAPR